MWTSSRRYLVHGGIHVDGMGKRKRSIEIISAAAAARSFPSIHPSISPHQMPSIHPCIHASIHQSIHPLYLTKYISTGRTAGDVMTSGGAQQNNDHKQIISCAFFPACVLCRMYQAYIYSYTRYLHTNYRTIRTNPCLFYLLHQDFSTRLSSHTLVLILYSRWRNKRPRKSIVSREMYNTSSSGAAVV